MSPGSGVMWLAAEAASGRGFCVTFARGAGEREIFLAFGADPDDARPRPGREMGLPAAFVQAGSSGPWRVAVEPTSRMGTRSAVLSRITASGQAVVVRKAAGKPIVQFAHAADGVVKAAVNSLAPDRWDGSAPATCRALAEQLGFGADRGRGSGLADLRAVLGLAERHFRLSLDRAALQDTWPAAPILPRLAELPLPHWETEPVAYGDPVADQMLASASEADLAAVVALRTRRLLAEAHLAQYPELLAAVGAALAGPPQPVTDEDRVGFGLRKISWLADQAGMHRVNPHMRPVWGLPPASEQELRHRQQLGNLVPVLRLVLAHRFSDALSADYCGLRWYPTQAAGLDQLRADLSQVIGL